MKFLSLLLAAVLMLSGCTLGFSQSAPTATDLLAKLLALPDTPATRIYFNRADPEEECYLSEETARRLYGVRSPLSLADEYAIALCTDDRIWEIHLFHAADPERAQLIESRLGRRADLLAKESHQFYEPDSAGAGATVFRRGRWVCLLVTSDNSAAKEILEKCL